MEANQLGLRKDRKNISLTNNSMWTRIHVLERYSKGLYAHQEITAIHEAVLEIWRGGMLHQVRFGMLVKMVMRRFL